jgi:2,4-dienoyl-CoA reductase-like NADH-dependent reductase (Old Yellow Enzyme family)
LMGNPAFSGLEPIGPSPLLAADTRVGRAMAVDEILAVRRAFAEAASMARSAAFDAVQVHAAHGYLLSEFLSPYFNRRTDSYGGGIEGRAALLLEVVADVRAAVGDDYPVLVKINAEDFLPGGLTVEDMVAVVVMLEAAGLDAVELSGGTDLPEGVSCSRVGRSAPGEPEAYYEEAARRCKAASTMPLMLVGGIRTFATAERLVANGPCDYIALSRPLIREPRLIERWRNGDTAPARCVSDNGCLEAALEGRGLLCTVEERLQRSRRGGEPVA